MTYKLPFLLKTVLVSFFALILLFIFSLPAKAMESRQIAPNLCVTKGGGKFVPIPNFIPHSSGAKIDKRLIEDLKWIDRNYNVYVTAGYAMSGHSMSGEHPLGLALDLVPSNGRWGTIDKLAKKAEPSQNNPRMPFRWVGYNGDVNHGRGNHLHLSWNHGSSTPGKPVHEVYTRNCPQPEVEAVKKFIEKKDMTVKRVECDKRGNAFKCDYSAFKFVSARNDENELMPYQKTEQCKGRIKTRNPFSKNTHFKSKRCFTHPSSTKKARMLVTHLSQYGEVTRISCIREKKAKCTWGLVYTDEYGTRYRVRGKAVSEKRSEEFYVEETSRKRL